MHEDVKDVESENYALIAWLHTVTQDRIYGLIAWTQKFNQ